MKFLSILKEFGFDLVLLLAGLAGGIASLKQESKLTRSQKFFSVISGAFAANYLTPLLSHWTGLNEFSYGYGFLLGYGGLKGVETVFRVFINKTTGNNLNP